MYTGTYTHMHLHFLADKIDKLFSSIYLFFVVFKLEF